MTMDDEKDVAIHQLNRKISKLEADNAKYRNYRDIARKYEFRITGVLLLVVGAIVSVVAYPSYNSSSVASLLLMVGVTSIFVGTVMIFINTERFVSLKIAEDLNLSSVIVLDNLLRDFRLKNKGIYLPSSVTGGLIKIFIPLRRSYQLPPTARLKDDRTFLVGLTNPAQEGVLLPPLGSHLFAYTKEELKVAWGEQHAGNAQESAAKSLQPNPKSFNTKLQAVFVKGLEVADRVDVTENATELRVRLQNTPYAKMCERLTKEAPQVCAQIGCPLCSLIACIYTEHSDEAVIIEGVQHDRDDITLTCKIISPVAREHMS